MPSSQNLTDPPRLDGPAAAAERIDKLDQLVGRVDGARVKASDVFQAAIEAIQKPGSCTATVHRNMAGDRTDLLNANPGHEVETQSHHRWQDSYMLTDQESIELTVVSEKPLDSEPWRNEFYRSMLDCCGIAFLKERYRLASSAKQDNSRRVSARPMVMPFAAILIVGFFAMWIPVRFRLSVLGTLAPTEAREVFAPLAGTLDSILVRDGQTVRRGDVLAILDQPEIDLQHERLNGELLTAKTEFAAARVNQNRPRRSDSPRPHSAQAAVLKARVRSLTKQVDLVGRVHDSLTIRAAIDGRVMMRDVQAQWEGKSVMQSQALMTIADPSSGFQAVLDLPSEQFAYLSDNHSTKTDQRSELNVEFMNDVVAELCLRSNPDVQFAGTVIRVGQTAFIDKHRQSVIEVTASLDQTQDQEPRAGASVIGHLDLGKRSLGFVLFRPLIERFRSLVW